MIDFKWELQKKEIFQRISSELTKAENKHPDWPVDNLFEQVAILTEEAGEVAKAALDFKFGKVHHTEIQDELLQTAAMCIRILKNLDKTLTP